jgi:hypothetical protein
MSPRPNGSTRSNGPQPDELPQNLTERVLARVADARLDVDLRARATRPKSKRRRQVAVGTSPADPQTPEETREAESLKRVFRDMGISYRRYRSQTGEPVVPGLRDAAYKFRAEPNISSLVAVAAYLDELDLLS